MEPNKIPSIKTQIAIVKTLLNGSPKPQRKIAEEIGKEESTISKAIGYLKKANVVDIVPKSIKSGGRSNTGMYLNNLCSLTYDLGHGVNILLFFKSVFTLKFLKESETENIINTLQKSDKILDTLLDQHPELCLKEFPPEAWERAREEEKKIPGVEETFKMIVEGTIEPGKEEFKKYLKISPAFFKICLLNDTKYIEQKVRFMYLGFAREYVFDEEQLQTIDRNRTPELRARNILYKFCVIMEDLNKSPDNLTMVEEFF
jgi:DNA-binding Lrp family transcriptional regulator